MRPRRRKWLVQILGVPILVALAVGAVVFARGGDDSGSSPRLAAANLPNVVWLMTDDQEVASMRVMPRTRRVLGRRGVTFAHSFAAWPLCCPSRATFQTGQHAHNHGVLENRPPLGGYGRLDSSSTLPVWLQEAGYTTVQVGEYINDYQGSDGVPPGWSEWYGLSEPANRYFKPRMNENGEIKRYGKRERDYSTDLFTRQATGFIRRHSREDDGPFLLSLGYVAPHVGKAFVSNGRCGENGPEPAPRHEGIFQGEGIPRTPAFNEDDVSDKPDPIRRLPKLRGALLREKTDRYQCRLESLLAVDESVSEIVRALRQSGELDNTYVFFTSDNGYVQGEHRLDGGKSVLYEESLRVPLLVRGPGIPQGRTARGLVSNVDWSPTILDIAGAAAGVPQDGTSMLPAARRPSLRRGRALLIESARERYTGVRTARYVYAEYYDGGDYAHDDVEMYDLRRDPHQLENLRDDPAYEDARENLARLLDRLRECEGEGCEAVPHLRLSVERQPVRRAAPCRAGRAVATVAGHDAGALRAARYWLGGQPVGRGGAEPREIAVPPGRDVRVRAKLELVDGRITEVDASLPGCDLTRGGSVRQR